MQKKRILIILLIIVLISFSVYAYSAREFLEDYKNLISGKAIQSLDNGAESANDKGKVIIDNKPESDGYLQIATLKKNYNIGERIELTDPPAEKKENFFEKISSFFKNVFSNIFKKGVVSSRVEHGHEDGAGKELSETQFGLNDITNLDRPNIGFTNIKQEGIIKHNYKGYIIKFKSPSIIEYKTNLEKQLKIKKDIGSLSNPSQNKEELEKINSEVISYESKIEDEQETYKEDIIQKLNIEEETDQKIVGEYKNTFNGIALDITDEEAKSLKNLDYVEDVYPNYEVNITLFDSAPLIQADKVWQLDKNRKNCIKTGNECLTGKGITVAVIDTGIDYTHSDLGSCFGNKCKVIDGYDFVNKDNDPMDDHGHGTHVAGIISAYGIVKGVAPESKLVAYKVLNEYGGGYSSDIIKAIERTVDPNQDGNFEDHYDIISMSLGRNWGSPDDPDAVAVDNAVNTGVIVIIAAGNSGPEYQTIGCPGCARKAITVGATDKQDKIAEFSSRGPVFIYNTLKPDVVAPGVDICSTQSSQDTIWESIKKYRSKDVHCIDNKHIAISGTSMATPMVAGAAALLKQANPDWISEEIKYALRNTATDLGYDFRTEGYGRINVFNSITLKEKQPIAILNDHKRISSSENIIGTTYSDNFKNYVLYYGEDYDPEQWIEIINSNNPVIEGTLSTFDVSYLKDGKYTIKLEVFDNNKQKSEDRIYVEVDNINLISPGVSDSRYGKYREFLYSEFPSMQDFIKNTYITKDFVEIKGTIVPGIVSDYSIDYANEEKLNEWSNEGIQITKNLGENITLGYWDLSSVKEGNYILRLTAIYEDKSKLELKKILVIVKNLHEGWPKPFIGTFVTLADIDKFLPGDELVIGTMGLRKDNRRISQLAVRDNKGNLLDGWPQETNFSSWTFPSVADLDGDGTNEIIIASGKGFRSNSKVFAFHSNGNMVNGWPKEILEDTISQTVLEDLDNDGKLEIIATSYYDNYDSSPPGYPHTTIHVLDYKGNYLPGWPKRFDNYNTWLPVSSGDLDNDGYNDIVVALSEMIIYPDRPYEFTGKTSIFAFDYKGNILKGFPRTVNSNDEITTPQLADVDNDGNLNIIFISNKEIYVLDNEGNLLLGWPRNVNILLTSPPVIGELDKNYPGLEIVINSAYEYETKMFIFHADGSLVNGWPKNVCNNEKTRYYPYMSASPVLYDLNNDDKTDIISTCVLSYNEDNSIYAFDINGNLIDGWPKKVLYGATFDFAPSSFSLGDVNGDNKLDLAIGADMWYEGYSIFLWNLDVPYEESKIEWSTIYNNPQHTGLYDKNLKQKEELPKSLINNTGTEIINGYLLFKIQKNIDGNWEDHQVVLDDLSQGSYGGYGNEMRIIKSGEYLALDQIFNPLNVNINERGDYRVYAALRDIDGNIIETNSGRLEDYYEFNIKNKEYIKKEV